MHSTGSLRPPLLVARADAVADGRFSPTRAILFRRGLTPLALGAGTTTIHRKNDDFAVHERTFDQERRASARRGLVKPTLRGENRALLCDHATDVQERRVSARGGSQTHPQWQTFFPNGNTCVPGWFTPAALGWACGSCCRWRFVSGVALVFAWLVYVSRCWKFVWRL